MIRAFIIESSVDFWNDTESYQTVPRVFSSLENAEKCIEVDFSIQQDPSTWSILDYGCIGKVAESKDGKRHHYKGFRVMTDGEIDFCVYNYTIIEVEVE